MLTAYEKLQEQAQNADKQAQKWLEAGREDRWREWSLKAATYRHAMVILHLYGEAPN